MYIPYSECCARAFSIRTADCFPLITEESTPAGRTQTFVAPIWIWIAAIFASSCLYSNRAFVAAEGTVHHQMVSECGPKTLANRILVEWILGTNHWDIWVVWEAIYSGNEKILIKMKKKFYNKNFNYDEFYNIFQSS